MVKGKIMPLNLLIITQQGVIYRPFSTLFFQKVDISTTRPEVSEGGPQERQ